MEEANMLNAESHADHDPQWLMNTWDIEAEPSCFACLLEKLQDDNLLTVKKKVVLRELLSQIGHSSQQLQRLLAVNLPVALHTALSLTDLLKIQDDSFQSLAIEGLIQLVCTLKREELICCVLDTISQQALKVCNYRHSVAILNLVGRLLNSIPGVAVQLVQNYGSFVDFACCGLCYPDESVQTAVAYICRHLYMVQGLHVGLGGQLNKQVSQGVLAILSSTQNHQLQMNALGVLKTMLEEESLMDLVMGCSPEGSSVPAILKRLLLSSSEVLKVGVVQSILTVLTVDRGQHWTGSMLDADVAEFLFEASATSNELLMGSIFCCLILCTDTPAFFKKCHAVYGMEAILRGVEQVLKQGSIQVVRQGMLLLANILDRHPGGIRLFSSLSLVQWCLQLLTEGVKHADVQISKQAARALAFVMRRNHLPSPVPYESVTIPLQALLGRVKILPLMHNKPVDGCLQKQHPSRGRTRAAEAGKIQQKIEAAFQVVENACRLAMDCSSDPSACQMAFSAPDAVMAEVPVSLQQFTYQLLQACDEFCIPVVMANFVYLESAEIFAGLFRILECLMELCGDAMIPLLAKITSAGFIGMTLEVKAKFRMVCKEVDSVLLKLCTRIKLGQEALADDDATISSWRQGLISLQGSTKDLMTVLTQDASVACDGHTAESQEACLCLLSIAYWHGDRVVDSHALLDALETFISLHPDLHELPSQSLSHLVFLYALSSDGDLQSTPRNYSATALSRLVEVTAGRSEVKQWCVDHPLLLQWCFRYHQVAGQLGKQLLHHWLLRIPASCREKVVSQQGCRKACCYTCMTVIVNLASKNMVCLKTLLSLLNDGNTAVVGQVVEILQQLLKQSLACTADCDSQQTLDGSSSQVILSELQSCLPEMLLKMLLTQSPNEVEDQLCGTLELVCQVKQHSVLDPLDAIDLKLAYHLSNLVEDQDSERQWKTGDLLVISILNCLLAQAYNHGDSRVAGMVMSHKVLMQAVGRGMAGQHYTACCTLATLMLHHHCLHPLQIEQPVLVDTSSILGRLKSGDHMDQVCALQWWEAFFNSVASPGQLVQLSMDETDQTGKAEDVDDKLVLSSRFVRQLAIYLQQCVVQEQPVTQHVAASCFISLLTYLHNVAPALEQHILCQPWNRLLLQVVLDQYDGNTLSGQLMTLCAVLMAGFHRKDIFRSSHLRTLLGSLLLLESSVFTGKSREKLVTSMKEILDSDLVTKVDNSTVSDVQLKVQHLEKSHEITGSRTHKLQLICVKSSVVCIPVTNCVDPAMDSKTMSDEQTQYR